MNTDEPTVRQAKAEFLKALDIVARNFSTSLHGGGNGGGGSGPNRTSATLAPSVVAAMTTSAGYPMPTPVPTPSSPPTPVLLHSLGFGLAGLTILAQLVLALLAFVRACRKRRRQHADCLYGLCAHAAIVGAIQGGYVTVAHTLLLARGPGSLDDPLWRINCKAYLFCRSLLPGLFLHLLASIGVAFKTVRYPARRCGGGFCGRAGSLAVHCLPWIVCSGALLPALVLHKDATESAIRAGRCAVPELWPWLAPVLVLFGLPQVALLLLTCLLCAFRPYAASADDEEDDDDESGEGAINGGEGEPRPPGYLTAANHLHLRHPQQQQPQQQLPPPAQSRTLLRGRPMRIARLLLIVLNCLEAATQLPYSVISLLQTVLRNRQARHLIPDDTVDIAFWLHLAFFPVASVFLAALVIQLDKAFQITEHEIHQRGGKVGEGVRGGPTDEVLYTASMLSSV